VNTIDDAIVARAAAFSGLTGLIGAQPNMKLYPAVAPQNAVAPYVTYQQISGPRIHAMGADPGVVNPRMQFTVWGRTNTEAKNVGLQVMLCFSRWRGIFATVDVMDSFLENELDLGLDVETKLHQRVIDFLMWHRE
jgi:hypothetical protein